MKKILPIVATLTIFAIGVYYFKTRSPQSKDSSVSVSEGVKVNSTPKTSTQEGPEIEVVAENLEIPWEVEFLANGDLLVTERPGRLLKIGADKKVYEIQGVRHIGEGGLLGVALHPNFASNNYIYLYLTATSNGQTVNRVERYRFENDELTSREVILEGIKGASNHDGGRIRFGPDGYLYITTGDAQQPSLAQDTNSLNGKILRIKDDGSIPPDNPFGNAVYSYGHRNAQGLAWDEQKRLWATEHGRSGVASGLDELNLIEPGKNYGWPEIEGNETREGMVTPVINSGATETWAPSGADFVNGSIFFAGLRGTTLYEAKLKGAAVSSLVKHFSGDYGRLRAVKMAPDGYLYITTSNRDGRGRVNTGDDKIIRIKLRIFE